MIFSEKGFIYENQIFKPLFKFLIIIKISIRRIELLYNKEKR